VRHLYYTPGQLRHSVGLSKEAFRHWKRVVPAFSNGRGHSPSFSAGDVLASAVLRRLTEEVGVRIGHLSEIASSIFQLCNESAWDVLENRWLAIELSKRTCIVVDDPRPVVTGELVLVCALSPVIKTLRRDLLNSKVLAKVRVPAQPSRLGIRVRRGSGR
jgi:hypothetical protein